MKQAQDKGGIPGLSKNALTVLEKRYLKRNKEGKALETPVTMFRRVAATIASADKKYDKKADIGGLTDKFYGMMAGFTRPSTS